MTRYEESSIIQALIKIISVNKNLTDFQLANQIYKEIIEPSIECERAIWERLLYVNKGTENSPH